MHHIHYPAIYFGYLDHRYTSCGIGRQGFSHYDPNIFSQCDAKRLFLLYKFWTIYPREHNVRHELGCLYVRNHSTWRHVTNAFQFGILYSSG